MSPYFLCYACSHVLACQQNNNVCPFCGSSQGRILTDDEFNKQYDRGTINLINPSTGKLIKKKNK